jgi:hypothetical protein
VFSIPYKRGLTGGLTLDGVERWSREPKVILEHRDRLLGSERIRLSLRSTVTGLNLSADGQRVESLAVSTPEGARTVKAQRFVLAMGGVETTRLLLHTQRRWPSHFGGAGGALGRYYMGHISGKIASIVFDDPGAIGDLDFKLDESGAYHRRRFMLTTAMQLQHKVLNTAFWPDNPSFYDPNHGSGVLSAVFLALAFPPTGRQLLPEAIRRAHTGPQTLSAGCASAQRDPGRTARRWRHLPYPARPFYQEAKEAGIPGGQQGRQICAALPCGTGPRCE